MTNLFIDFFCAFTFLFLLFLPTLSNTEDGSVFSFSIRRFTNFEKFNVPNSTSNVPLTQAIRETTEFSGMKREKLEIGDRSGGSAGRRAEDEAEEVEMEKFWDLVGILREEVGHRRRKADNEEEGEKRKKRKEEKGWVPAFEKEDFTKDIEFIGLPLIFPRPCNHIKKDEEKQEDCKVGLDLKLKL